LACDSTNISGYDDNEKTRDEPPDKMFNKQRLQEAVSEESFIDPNSFHSSPEPMRQQRLSLMRNFNTYNKMTLVNISWIKQKNSN
jgi:hypothetical protein